MSLTHVLAAGAAVAGLALAPVPAALASDGAVRFASCPDLRLDATLEGYGFSLCFDNVVTPSGRAIAHLGGRLTPGVAAPARAVTIRDFGCLAAYPSSFDLASSSRLVVTPNGRVNGTCRL